MNATNVSEHTLIGTPQPGFAAALRAELLRSRRSSTLRIPMLGLLIAILQGLGWWVVATQELSSWHQLYFWTVIYATAMQGPLIGLVVGLHIGRESRAREGGTLWRPVSPRTISLARAAVLYLAVLFFDLAITVPMLGFGLAAGLPEPPLGMALQTGFLLWAASGLWIALAILLSRLTSMGFALGAGLVWQLAGTLMAEKASWWWQPWTWMVRPMLPVLGVHANGVALEAGSPVWEYPVWPLAFANLALGLIVVAATATWGPVRLRLWRHGAANPAPTAANPAVRTEGSWHTGRPHRVLAMSGSLRRTPIDALTITAAALLVAVALLWEGQGVMAFTGGVLLPFGTCLLACLVWNAQQPALRALAVRTRTSVVAGALAVDVLARLAAMWLWCAALLLFTGSWSTLFLVALAACAVTLSTLNLWLAARFGTGTAIATTILGTAMGLVFAAPQIVEVTWVATGYVFPLVSTDPFRVLLGILASSLVTASAGALWLRALSRAAGQ
ncbi:ABC-2 family transporter permease [Gephyromycinifex aptenodytis]|uniref:hypothetical protein n=1 Tax=Gephyromycinifex aptenodytis TaxID=2716227 RepID=UPI0014463C2B|nr:hypothetical protein [Gephyromycinifex aptenodytis]